MYDNLLEVARKQALKAKPGMLKIKDDIYTFEFNQKTWAVLQDVDGKSGKGSEIFKTYETSHEALKACNEYNKFLAAHGITANAYIVEGNMTEQGFISI